MLVSTLASLALCMFSFAAAVSIFNIQSIYLSFKKETALSPGCNRNACLLCFADAFLYWPFGIAEAFLAFDTFPFVHSHLLRTSYLLDLKQDLTSGRM